MMRDADAFDETLFLGAAANSKRDSYRLALFARHLDEEERPLALLTIRGGTLIVTDRRILDLRAHLEVHGAWNVKEFQGYEIRRQIARSAIRTMEHQIAPARDRPGVVEDSVLVDASDRVEVFTVSSGPEPTLSASDFERLRTASVGHAK